MARVKWSGESKERRKEKKKKVSSKFLNPQSKESKPRSCLFLYACQCNDMIVSELPPLEQTDKVASGMLEWQWSVARIWLVSFTVL